MAAKEASAVRLRSIYVSRIASDDAGEISSTAHSASVVAVADDAEKAIVAQAPSTAIDQFVVDDINNNINNINDDEVKESKDPIQLPESTHSLLFTECGFSLPFWFALGVVFLSFACLWLAFWNNVMNGGTAGNQFNIPVNVDKSVRIAQYLSIFIALLMEEEIPTGLFLLRQIRIKNFRKKLPTKKYRKFFMAAILRIFSGYFFLVNVFVILIQADGVIEIFYDVLALQFVQQLDDIAFNLAKIDVLGKRLMRACTSSVFHTEFEKQKHNCKKSEAFLKALYFLNLGCLLAGMIVVSIRQEGGYYQCQSVTVNFGDKVWEPAFALNTTSGAYEEWTLVFSYFNGVFVDNGTKEASRPVYREMRKFDRGNYKTVFPAEIKYCSEISAWVFTHDHIRRSEDDQSGCNWLLRSPETNEYDVMNVEGDWKIWTGLVSTSPVSIQCNSCNDNVDCNLNGKCVNGECQCRNKAGAQYLGTFCEVRLSDECQTIMGERANETFRVDYYNSDGNGRSLVQEYSRPAYTYVGGVEGLDENGTYWLTYTGSRWFGMYFDLAEMNKTLEDVLIATQEFHAFWNRAYDTYTYYVSDPTSSSTPVGVDWYEIGERGSQFGPFGALYPSQLNNQTGRGFFRCAGEHTTSFKPATSDRRLQSRKPSGRESFFNL